MPDISERGDSVERMVFRKRGGIGSDREEGRETSLISSDSLLNVVSSEEDLLLFNARVLLDDLVVNIVVALLLELGTDGCVEMALQILSQVAVLVVTEEELLSSDRSRAIDENGSSRLPLLEGLQSVVIDVSLHFSAHKTMMPDVTLKLLERSRLTVLIHLSKNVLDRSLNNLSLGTSSGRNLNRLGLSRSKILLSKLAKSLNVGLSLSGVESRVQELGHLATSVGEHDVSDEANRGSSSLNV